MIREKPNSRARTRDYMWRKARRKRRLDRELTPAWSSIWMYYNNLHQYSKNKIHCSCPDCSPKTRNKGHRRYKAGNYSRSINYKMSDLRRQLTMDDQEKEYYIDFS